LVIASALTGAIAWNLLSWFLGIPSSSSHALIGGLLGAFVAGWGPNSVQWGNVKNIVLIMVASPLVGFMLTYLFTKWVLLISQYFSITAKPLFQFFQVLTLAFQSLAHGTNDAQKTMGVITFTLILTQFYRLPVQGGFVVPHWVVLSCSGVIALGVMTGGWRIIKTLGGKLYRIRTVHSFTSQSASALIIYAASLFGFPISTTQVISSSIMGAGAASRPKSVRWAVAGDMAMAWLVTIPASAGVAFGTFKLTTFLFN
jgi:PiT family inorganic phosphate transporter